MHLTELILGVGYISIAWLEHKLVRHHSKLLIRMEKGKQAIMAMIGAGYVAHAGAIDIVLRYILL